MTELALHGHPLTFGALQLARLWCDGQRVGSQDALAHALAVVDVLLRHIPDAAPEVVAAALLHDSPDLAPRDVDLHAALVTLLSPEVARLVEGLQREHDGLDSETLPRPPVDDLGLLQASAADKIVSIRVVLDGAAGSDPEVYWRRRQAFAAGLIYMRSFLAAVHQVLPATMVEELDSLLCSADERITEAGCR